MGRPEIPVDPSGGVAAAFASDLRRLRRQAGSPTYRDLARSALFSSSVLSSAASGRRLPTLQVTLAFVAACGGDRDCWRRRWLQASANANATRSIRLADQRAAARAAPPRPAQLPPRPRGFMTRADELRRLGVASGTPVVINGPFGVGKSEFALHYAHSLAPIMIDGQLYGDFAPLMSGGKGAQAVVSGFLNALGVPPHQLPAAADQQAGLYRTLLADRRLVVLLDNVRDEGQVRPLLAETPGSVTIVVSRAALLGLRDVCRMPLGVVSRADSIAMIAAAVGAAAADPDACARLAELCGDLPLALDIAVRRLTVRPDIPLRWVTQRLAQPGSALGWLQIGDLSVRKSLASAYRRLGDAARTLLAHLVLMAAHEPVGWIEGTRQRSTYPVEQELTEDELIEELIDGGMLRRGASPSGYRLDPLVRIFVDEVSRRRGGHPSCNSRVHDLTAPPAPSSSETSAPMGSNPRPRS